jgi:hypothetical protein
MGKRNVRDPELRLEFEICMPDQVAQVFRMAEKENAFEKNDNS